MAKITKPRKEKPMTLEQAAQKLPVEISRREHLLGEYQKAHAEYHAAHDNLAAYHRAMSRSTNELKKSQAIIDKLRAIIDAGPSRPEPELRETDAPLMTDAEFYHQREINPDIENPARSTALFSMDEYIGGYSRYPTRLPHREMAAARILSLYERSQIGGAKASDLSQPFVDRSGPSAGSALAAGEDARRDYKALGKSVDKAVGNGGCKLLERIIVMRISTRKLAGDQLGKKPHQVPGRAVASLAQQFLNALDAAAAHFDLA